MEARIKELTASEVDHLEWLLGTIEAKCLVGEPLTATETELREALSHLEATEQIARQAFQTFYTALPGDSQNPNRAGDNAVPVPPTVAATIADWVAARRIWDTLITRLLSEPSPSALTPVRTGPRLRATLPEFLRVPTACSAHDLFSLLFAPQQWVASPEGMALEARRGTTRVRIECDEALGFGPEQAFLQIARHGASVVQTFFALIGLWLERNPGVSHETYMTVYASDVLRFQQRKETKKGGYHRSDVLAKGRDIYLLSRIHLPQTTQIAASTRNTTAHVYSLGRLLSLESLEIVMSEPDARNDITAKETQSDEGQTPREATLPNSIVRFRYHLGREVFEWVKEHGGDYTLLSGKLLTYHPVRQKYQILLGLSLAAQRHDGTTTLTLLELLERAAIPVPDKRIAAFFATIEDALDELARDGIVPGMRLIKPPQWPELLAKRATRRLLAESRIETESRVGGAGAKPEIRAIKQLPPL